MRATHTLFRYICGLYLNSFLAMMGGLLSVVFIFDAIELIRRLSKRGEIDFLTVIELSIHKLPEVGLKIIPFVVFFTAIFMFWRMTRSHELVVIRASGVSAWQFIFPIIVTVLCLGVLKITVINPISAALLKRYETLEFQHLENANNIFDLARTGFWMKEDFGDQTMIIHATTVKVPEWKLHNPSLMFFDQEHNFLRRIDAQQGTLTQDGLKLLDIAVFDNIEKKHSTAKDATLHTKFTPKDVENRFSSPQTISFWSMPHYINLVEKTGLAAAPLRAHYYSLLFEPFLYIGLTLIAAVLSLRPPRRNQGLMVVTGSIGTAFLVFFLGDLLSALGISERLPVIAAAFAPSLITVMIGFWGILHLEDG